MRIFVGAFGVFAAFVAVAGPLLYLVNVVDEWGAPRIWGGHPSFWGGLGGSLAVLIIAGFFALIAYNLLRFAVKGPKSHGNQIDAT